MPNNVGRDIKITLSLDASRAESIEAEAAWLQEQGQLWYPVGKGQPKFAKAGCWVYFIRKGLLVARAVAKTFKPAGGAQRYSYAGKKTTSTAWEVAIQKMELATRPLPHKGFQGFRYVGDAETPAFEAAFAGGRGGR